MDVVNIKDDDSPLNQIPHTPEAGDPYRFGDVYERSPVAQEWEIDTTKLPYLTHIKSLANSWPPLRYLADWMEVGTTPLRWDALKKKPSAREERAQRTNVKVLEYTSTNDVHQIHVTDASDLRETVFSSPGPTEESEKTSLRLLFVQDLSRQVIEILGSRFDVDPMFFRSHIVDYSWYNTRDPWNIAPSLTAEMNSRQWFSVRNMRLRYFASDESFQKARLQMNSWNILRRIDDDQNHWYYLDKPGSIVSLGRTRTSVWIGKDPKGKFGTVGIILVDPSVEEGFPLWSGSTNWMPRPSFADSERVETDGIGSVERDLINWTLTYPWFSLPNSTPTPDLKVFVKPVLFRTCAEWLHLCEYLKTRMGQTDWELEKPTLFRAKGDQIDRSLARLHTWRRTLSVLRDMVDENLEQSLVAAARLTGSKEEAFGDIKPDYLRVRRALDEFQARVDRNTSVVTAVISMEDSRRGLQENNNLARLTWMATTFIPLSYVSGLFSMQTDIATMKYTFGWYFLAAVPLTVCTLLLASSAHRFHWGKKKNDQDAKIADASKKT